MPAQEMKGTQFFHMTLGAANVGAVTAATPASGRDRVYSGDQTSNTVSIIDPATNTLLGIIRLGDPARSNRSTRASCSSMGWASRPTTRRWM